MYHFSSDVASPKNPTLKCKIFSLFEIDHFDFFGISMFNRYLQDPRIMQTVAILLGIESEVADNEGIPCFEWNLFCKTTLKSSERAFWLPMKFIEIFLRLKKRHFKINFVMWHLKSLHHHHHQKKNQLVSQWKQKNHNQNLNQKLILQSKRLVCIWWMLWLRNVFFLLHLLLLLLQMLSSLIATSNGLGIFLTSSKYFLCLHCFFCSLWRRRNWEMLHTNGKTLRQLLIIMEKLLNLIPQIWAFSPTGQVCFESC